MGFVPGGDISYSIIGWAMVATSLFFVPAGFYYRRLARKLTRLEMRKVTDLGLGLAKVRGRIFPFEATLKSPARKLDCLCYRFVFDKYDKSGQYSGWRNMVDDTTAILSGLEDDTGIAEVDLNKVKLQLTHEFVCESEEGTISPDEIRELLREVYDLPKKGHFRGRWRLTESVLEPDSRVLVVGEVTQGVETKWRVKKGRGEYLVTDNDDEGLKKIYTERARGWVVGSISLMFAGICVIAVCRYLGI